MSSKETLTVAPTRMNLLDLRNRKKLAENGYNLLKEKRDALIIELYNLVDQIKGARSSADELLNKAHKQLEVASLKTGSGYLKELGWSAPETLKLKTSTNNIMGVRVPKLDLEQSSVKKPFYAAENTSIALDDTIVAFREYLNSAINVAEKIAALQKLAYEIASVNRRVNALEQIVIPRFENTIIKIDQALEEDERESFTRMKMVKAKLLNKEDEN
ncbi:V-type ATP synthase subunit D [archaeon]|jgi:V/A-type H+-transporting ATPase subunit D|nr:V-type ATP synthase subunit D [Asgard group archaeon]NDB29091.1 V-type ATP synthase subunit D [archaeon]NDB79207.1 V-type ATP synthase subunit D [archaeon]|tara:strand:+ start:8940 stop:9587 length:648 start_codon:yes stop_codon:yes gene_type:complete